MSFVDVFVQKGFKIVGTARNVRPGEPGFDAWAAPLAALAGPRFPIHSVIVVEAVAVEAILAPSYRLYAAETTEPAQIRSAMHRYGVQPANPDR